MGKIDKSASTLYVWSSNNIVRIGDTIAPTPNKKPSITSLNYAAYFENILRVKLKKITSEDIKNNPEI